MVVKKYKINLRSARNFNPEKCVKVLTFNHEWNFVDKKLGFPIQINLKEKAESGKAVITAVVNFDKKYSSKIDEIDDYIALQLEYISKDGMVDL